MSICFYHKSDLDGKCSAAIIKYENPECKCIGVDYGDGINPLDHIELGKECYVVDFSFDMEIMKELNKKTHLVWIDHHKTAIDKHEECYQKYGAGMNIYCIKGKREIGKAGCELTWEYIFPEKDMPEAVKLLGRYDIWDNEDEDYWNDKILPFQYGMKIFEFNQQQWELIMGGHDCPNFKEVIINKIKEGKTILDYQSQQNKQILGNNNFEIEFEGHKAICLNNQVFNSQVYDSKWDEDKYDIMICFAYTGKNWKVSLYSTKDNIDVSEIAKKHSGGGHKGASGFIVNDINSLILNNNKKE